MKNLALILLIISSCLYRANAQEDGYAEQINQAVKAKDSAAVVYYLLKRIKKPELDSAGMNKVFINNLLYNFLFRYSKNKTQLLQGAEYMKTLIAAPPKDAVSENVYAVFLDTYASLLYKAGKEKEALTWEEKSLQYGDDQTKKNNRLILGKMRQNLPIW